MELHLSLERFWAMTPGYFWRMVHLHEASLRRRDDMLEIMVAQLIAKVHNTSLVTYKKPIAPGDCMPSQWARQPKRKRQTKAQRQQRVVDQIRTAMMATAAMHGVKTTPPAAG